MKETGSALCKVYPQEGVEYSGSLDTDTVMYIC